MSEPLLKAIAAWRRADPAARRELMHLLADDPTAAEDYAADQGLSDEWLRRRRKAARAAAELLDRAAKAAVR